MSTEVFLLSYAGFVLHLQQRTIQSVPTIINIHSTMKTENESNKQARHLMLQPDATPPSFPGISSE